MTSELSAAGLMRQAGMTAENYMINGKQDIDKIMGDGYAKAHPELLAAYMQAAALDFHATFLAKELTAGMELIADTMRLR
jgi:hypothetical protein